MLNALIVIGQFLSRLLIKTIKSYSEIWRKVSNLMDMKFDSEPVYGDNDKYVKTKILRYIRIN